MKTLIRVGRLSLEFKLEDLWVGAFWKSDSYETWHRYEIDNPALRAIGHKFEVWVCVIPCFPIHYERHWRDGN